MTDLDSHRRFFADLITTRQGKQDVRIRDAFATVPREKFLPPGPWHVVGTDGYIQTPSDDPIFVYHNAVIAIDPERNINNGQPSLHVKILDSLSINSGDTIFQVGTGNGYYSAILSELTGPTGHVHAIEIDPDLAATSAQNLNDRDNVSVECRSGTEPPFPACDIIYVSAGATEPLSGWLDALNPGGRLMFPLTPGWGRGGMLLITRVENGWSASFINVAYFIPCTGAQNEAMIVNLEAAFSGGRSSEVKSLIRNNIRDETCWIGGDGWWLSYSEPNTIG